MEILLNDAEVRVLGSLIEKEMTTPEYYPLSLNGLTNACNQKSNRNPVVQFDEHTTARAIDSLKAKQLVWQSDASRVPKYGQSFVNNQGLVNGEAAIMCELMIRGPQTLGELRSRCERMHKFNDLEAVEQRMQNLIELGLALKLPRQPGRKEFRYGQLLAGEPEIGETAQARPEAATLEVLAENKRIADLEEKMIALRQELVQLKSSFETFKKQFE